MSWNESYPAQTKDAEDLLLIMNNNEDAGNLDRLYEEEPDLLQEEKFDTRLAGIRLLGRDIARIVDLETLRIVQGILEEETGDQSRYRLIMDLIKGSTSFEEKFDETLEPFIRLKAGFSEIIKER